MTTVTQDSYKVLLEDCWESRFHCFGYAYLFQRRSRKFSKWVNWLKVFGLLTPALVGSVALATDLEQILPTIKFLATIILIIQFLFSVWAVIFKWDEELSYSFEAAQAHSSLSDRFEKLAKVPPIDINEFKLKFETISTEYRLRSEQDYKHGLKEWELRRGMRSALRQYKKTCIACKITPVSLRSSDCDVCGNFAFRNQLL